MEMNFFDVEKVQKWAEMAEQPYDSTDGRHQEIAKIAQELYLQLEHWGDLITQKIDTLVLTGSKMWLDRGKTFRKYLWMQLKSIDHKEIPVFFTIEVNSYDRKESWGNSVADRYNRKEHDCSLVIKMDVQWAGTQDTLPPDKVAEFEKLLPDAARWKVFYISDHDWMSLTEESTAFIRRFYADFHSILRKYQILTKGSGGR